MEELKQISLEDLLGRGSAIAQVLYNMCDRNPMISYFVACSIKVFFEETMKAVKMSDSELKLAQEQGEQVEIDSRAVFVRNIKTDEDKEMAGYV